MKSSLINWTSLSPNYTHGRDGQGITRITPHCVVGEFDASTVAGWFNKSERKASANYIIGKDGKILCNVLEENRAWTSGSRYNDYRAITIECSSGKVHPYEFNTKVFDSLKMLILDICKRYNKMGIVISESENHAEVLEKEYPNFFVITYHKYYQNVACPGQWCINHMKELANYVNAKLLLTNESIYKVQVGAFKIRENAEKLKNKLVEQGYSDAFIIEQK